MSAKPGVGFLRSGFTVAFLKRARIKPEVREDQGREENKKNSFLGLEAEELICDR